ncbi:MAG: Fe-S-cluster-containing hydrogenase [Gemmatimonadales bacterium]|nr:MAG: Fe-S-cluster-containing hydrogenase [Gemmatimonadales bacterium]
MSDSWQMLEGEGARMNRRKFLKVLGVAGGGTVALSGCAGEPEKLIPYLIAPEDQIPGVATWYATTCRECPGGCGVHAKVREGRVVKLEGNPDHPVNRGKLCARGQAALQGVYNPDRVRSPLARTAGGDFEPISWEDALQRVAERLGSAERGRIWFLTGNEKGTFEQLVREWLSAFGSGRHVVYEPFGYEALRRATLDVFGIDGLPFYHLDEARYILSFGADFLETWLSPVELTRRFTASHAFQNGSMGRLVQVEPRMGLTGMNADEWIAPVPGTEGLVALAIAHVIVRDRLARVPADVSRIRQVLDAHTPEAVAGRSGVAAETIERLAREFTAESSVALPGGVGSQHAQAHASAAAVHLLNYVAGNVGRTVTFAPGYDPSGGSSYRGLADLAAAARNGEVGVLLVHGANPVYASPAGLGFAQAMRQISFKVSFSRFLDETAREADLILPDHDPLEQWNDYEPRPGVYALQQPVMQPVFDTRQTGDVLLELARISGGRAAARFSASTYRDYLMERWRQIQRQVGARGTFEEFWNEALRRGGVWTEVRGRGASLAAGVARLQFDAWSAPEGSLTLIAYPSSALYDGRGANRPWLQELPDPVTKVTWGSWVEIHPETAARMGVAEGEFVEVSSEAGAIRAPAYLYQGVRPDVVAVAVGQGHTAFGRYAEGRGVNVYGVLGAQPQEFGGIAYYAAVSIRKTGEYERLAKTEGTPRQLGRGIAQATTLAEMLHGEFHPEHTEHAAEVPEHIEEVLEQWQERQYADWRNRGNYAGEHPRWGMVIDLSRCTGCSACVTACYAENNIPTVGKAAVQRGREMSWLRIERYFEGGNGEPFEARVIPMLCQHCTNAPCEPVCPVFAAYHTPDGLNAQVYNRCVGTRYCSNNCPYKVRYFNWFDYQNPADPAFAWPDPLHWLLNPDITVRSKGVMEKCTFCIQRIRGAQHRARMEGIPIRDGDIKTACEQTCPADAIVFGDLNDPDSRVSRLALDPRGYKVLEGLNTRPAITYLARVRNRAEE